MDTTTLIWLFPIAFMLHDFEEIILGEPWLNRNGADIRQRLQGRVPAFLAKQIEAALEKSTSELAFAVSLIFALTFIAAFQAAVYGRYGFFLLASGTFFLHGFMHLGQSIALRRYVPAVITSALVAIPYGLVLYSRLLGEGIIDLPGLLVYALPAIILVVPFIMVMLRAGSFLYHQLFRLLIGPANQ